MTLIPFLVDPTGPNAGSYKALNILKKNGLVVVGASNDADPNVLVISLDLPPAPTPAPIAATTGTTVTSTAPASP